MGALEHLLTFHGRQQMECRIKNVACPRLKMFDNTCARLTPKMAMILETQRLEAAGDDQERLYLSWVIKIYSNLVCADNCFT